MNELFALDIETTGLDYFKDRIIGIGLFNPSRSLYFDSAISFGNWFNDHADSLSFVTHGGSFDVNFLRYFNVDVSRCWLADTRSLASLLIPRPGIAEGQKNELGLENLGIKLFNCLPYKLDRTRMESYHRDEIKNYCLKDCQLTYQLYEYLSKHLPKGSFEFSKKWLQPATQFCTDLEWNGIHVDESGLQTYQLEIQKRRDQVLIELGLLAKAATEYYHSLQISEVKQSYKEMHEKAEEKAKDKEKCQARYDKLCELAIGKIGPFNWSSPKQLQWLLRDYYCLDIHSDREDKETTNEAMLKTLDHPVAKKLCEYRELEKLVSTCIPALLKNISKDGNVHAHYSVGGTRTGRLSSSGPNLQQLPRGQLRSYVRTNSSNFKLFTVDYSQIEVRLIAHLAKETELIHAFKEGIDPYSVIANKLLKIDCDLRELRAKYPKERDVAKTAGLSILYGTGAAKLQEVLNKELNRDYSLTQCKRFIEEYRESLPGVKQLRKNLERSLANQKVCYNLLGRPFAIDSNDDIYMKGLNTLVQGSASDLVIWSQTHFVIPELKRLGVEFKHRMIIHDEVVIELNADEAELLATEIIIPAMTKSVEKALTLEVPLAVEYNISREWAKP